MFAENFVGDLSHSIEKKKRKYYTVKIDAIEQLTYKCEVKIK